MRKEGFSFDFNPEKCLECKGRCCSSKKPSYLPVNSGEISKIASFLKLSESELKKEYLRRNNSPYNIKDIKFDGYYSCVFLDRESGRCSIYEARPKQCMEFPFWDCYRTDYETLIEGCPAIAITTNKMIESNVF